VNSGNGSIVLQNPAPGSTGNAPLSTPWARWPGQLGLAWARCSRFARGIALTFRADIINILNKPRGGFPIPTSTRPRSAASRPPRVPGQSR
jgi:hypothetical protein